MDTDAKLSHSIALFTGFQCAKSNGFAGIFRGILFADGLAMSKLTWIVSALLCAGCVTTQPLQDDGTVPVGKSTERVKETISKTARPTPVSRQETATSPSITRPNPQPVKTSGHILPANSYTEKAGVEKAGPAHPPVVIAKAQTFEPSPSTSVNKDEQIPANIIIKGAPKEAKPEPNQFFANKLRQKDIVWGVGGIAVAICGWVFMKPNEISRKTRAKGKNAKGKNEAKDEMEKAWKQGGVFK